MHDFWANTLFKHSMEMTDDELNPVESLRINYGDSIITVINTVIFK